jgi:hypothetical protein
VRTDCRTNGIRVKKTQRTLASLPEQGRRGGAISLHHTLLYRCTERKQRAARSTNELLSGFALSGGSFRCGGHDETAITTGYRKDLP